MTEKEEEFKVTEKQLNEAKGVFKVFDKKGNGKISTKDLVGIFKSLGLHADAEQLKEWSDEADEDATGFLEWEQFEPILIRKLKLDDEEKEMRGYFMALDKEKKGVIPNKYVIDLLMALGEGLTERDVQEMIAETDTDNNGTVDYEEFKALMNG